MPRRVSQAYRIPEDTLKTLLKDQKREDVAVILLISLNPDGKTFFCLRCLETHVDCTLSKLQRHFVRCPNETHEATVDKVKAGIDNIPGCRAEVERRLRSLHQQAASMDQFLNAGQLQKDYMKSIHDIVGRSGLPLTFCESTMAAILTETVKLARGLSRDGKTSIDSFERVIKALPLSDNSIRSGILDAAQVSRLEIEEDMKDCLYAIQLDETTDITDIAQMAVFGRYIKSSVVKEVFLGLVSFQGNTTAQIVAEETKRFLAYRQLSLEKCVGIATDGAALFTGSQAGVCSLLQQENPAMVRFHCVIHRFALACRKFPDYDVSRKVDLLVRKIRQSSLTNRQIKRFFTSLDDGGPTNLPYWNQIRWLSRARMLGVVFDRRAEIVEFCASNQRENRLRECVLPLLDSSFIPDLAFVADIYVQLAKTNVALQGKGKSMFVFAETIRTSLDIIASLGGLEAPNEVLTPRLASVGESLPPGFFPKWRSSLRRLERSLRLQLNDFLSLCDEPVKKFIRYPFQDAVLENTAIWGAALPEARQICRSDSLKDIYRELEARNRPFFDPAVFWCQANISESFPELWKRVCPVLTYFTTTYSCESLFSKLNFVKDKHRTRMKDDLLEAYLFLQSN